MRKQWRTERQKNPLKCEIDFENLLKKNGYLVLGIREYISKTDYLIGKDNTKIEYSIQDARSNTGERLFSTFRRHFEIKRRNDELEKMLEKTGGAK